MGRGRELGESSSGGFFPFRLEKRKDQVRFRDDGLATGSALEDERTNVILQKGDEVIHRWIRRDHGERVLNKRKHSVVPSLAVG